MKHLFDAEEGEEIKKGEIIVSHKLFFVHLRRFYFI